VNPIDAVLLGGLVVAALTDLRTGRIPNVLTLPMMLLGIVMHATLADSSGSFLASDATFPLAGSAAGGSLGAGPAVGLLGCAAAFAIHYPLWMLGVQKAGDAKLFMGVGACVGWRELIEASMWYAIVYLPVALLVLAAAGQLPGLWKTARYVTDKARGRPVGDPPVLPEAVAVPFTHSHH
jgi:prepilin peptidase CpaA